MSTIGGQEFVHTPPKTGPQTLPTLHALTDDLTKGPRHLIPLSLTINQHVALGHITFLQYNLSQSSQQKTPCPDHI